MIDMIDKFVVKWELTEGINCHCSFSTCVHFAICLLVNKNREIYLSDPALNGYSFTDSLITSAKWFKNITLLCDDILLSLPSLARCLFNRKGACCRCGGVSSFSLVLTITVYWHSFASSGRRKHLIQLPFVWLPFFFYLRDVLYNGSDENVFSSWIGHCSDKIRTSTQNQEKNIYLCIGNI